ncbi:unnamed protein product [Miscanthus lutarioriparius]|uniref:Uncharacterized protein n=1 Tax=Miscanthus lutarioriparius TaxID=422564 RepID=A0A811QKY8_9POAL|nr:unnamed protein product [Miscanthus lutarioriparius]
MLAAGLLRACDVRLRGHGRCCLLPPGSRRSGASVGRWVVDLLDGVAVRYEAVERRTPTPGLRRRHAEREHQQYAAARNAAVSGVVPGPAGGGEKGWRRPLITHFVGCQPCSGGRNPMYSRESCDDGMRRALAFADDQVLRAYGFRHAAPLNDSVRVLPFD